MSKFIPNRQKDRDEIDAETRLRALCIDQKSYERAILLVESHQKTGLPYVDCVKYVADLIASHELECPEMPDKIFNTVVERAEIAEAVDECIRGIPGFDVRNLQCLIEAEQALLTILAGVELKKSMLIPKRPDIFTARCTSDPVIASIG